MSSKQELITVYDETLIRVSVPVPLALKSVNSYLLKDGNGYVWVDPGLNTIEIQHIWSEVFSTLNIKPQHITKIICTHQHPDHFGLAGFAQQWTNAPVYMSQKALDYANLLWADEQSYPHKLQTLFMKHGVPAHLTSSIVQNLHWFRSVVLPFPTITFIANKEQILINDRAWTFIETSGHAKGQMMLYEPHTKTMLCGDQVLPHITPHVGVVPSEEDELPLRQFLQCLEQIKVIDVARAFAGHGKPIENWTDRIEWIVVHHQRRLEKMCDFIAQHDQLSAFEMSNLVFGEHLHQQPQNLRFAITEIIAHLDYLTDQGQISKSELEGSIIYK